MLMNGIVYIDDSRVARVEVEKYMVPRIEAEFHTINR
jgi:uncharacterized protein YigE (DUF2233 family)